MIAPINQHDSQGRPHGVWKNYWADGTPWWRAHYLHGKLHGVSEKYNKDGTLWWRYRYLHGSPSGLSENCSGGTPYNKRYFLTIK